MTWALGHADKAGRAWVVGDIRTVKANYGESRFGACVLAAVRAMGDIDARNIADTVAAIDAALNQPGKTIAVVNMGPLLRKNGVLEQLEARHVAIEGPAGLDLFQFCRLQQGDGLHVDDLAAGDHRQRFVQRRFQHGDVFAFRFMAAALGAGRGGVIVGQEQRHPFLHRAGADEAVGDKARARKA